MGAEGVDHGVSAYFTRSQRRINEAKLLLVGQGSVGKTSLIKRLLHKTFDPNEDSTHGIERHRWSVRANGEEVRVNVWDFGGQEIMHATHQFFLTRRSVYVLVVDSRVDEQENRIEYWLKLMQSFGGESPVIVVCNKADQHRLDLAKRRLMEKHPAIVDFYETSCKSGDGIDALARAIETEIAKLAHVRDALPEPWFELKRELEGMTKNFLPLAEFEALCTARGVTAAPEQKTLLRLFHDLGTILSFHDDPRLQDTNVLSPAWVTNGVYKILNWNDLFQAKGVLEMRRLGELLDPGEYPAKTHLFLIDMMRKFELCFPFEGAAGERYLVPALLPKDEPDTGSWEGAITFEYHYDILPDSIISRFLVRMHHLISKRTYWRYGAVLAKDECRAFVRADTTDGIVEIRIVGGGSIAARIFLGEIRGQLDAVHANLAGPKPAPKVVRIVEGKRAVIDYDDLITNEEEGIETILAPGTRTMLSVRELLNGVSSPEERRFDLAKSIRIESELLVRTPEERRLDQAKLAEPAPEPKVEPEPRPPARSSPWTSGSFYLFALVVVIAASAGVAHTLSWLAVPAVLVAGVIGVGVIGALQLRHDDRLKEKSFLSLMGETYRQLPLIRGSASQKTTLALPDEEPAPSRTFTRQKGKAPAALPAATEVDAPAGESKKKPAKKKATGG